MLNTWEVDVTLVADRQEEALARVVLKDDVCSESKERLVGPRLVRATRPYAQEDVGRSRWLLAQTLMILVLLHTGIIFAPMWAKPIFSVVTGGVYVRLFIFYHDFLHGAQLTTHWLTRFLMHGVGYLMLTTTGVWRETHDFHHRCNARVIGSGIGSFPVVTLKMWEKMSPRDRRLYKILRHPMTIVFGYVTVFMLGMSIAPFRRDPKKHWQSLLALVIHIAAIVGVGLWMGWWQAFFSIVLPLAVSMAAGSYLFYVQHNFPDVTYFERRAWKFDQAAIRSSSMFDMPRWAHWFTGNIGYHHIHHLNHRIPFYRLPEVYEAIEELQQPGRTTWRPRDIKACLSLAVWDAERARMITHRELRESLS